MRNKDFDAVQFMRRVRDKMRADMRDMTFEEQRVYIEQQASKVRDELEYSTRPQSRRSGKI